MDIILVSVAQFVLSAAILCGATAYLAHYVKEDEQPKRTSPERKASGALSAAQHTA